MNNEKDSTEMLDWDKKNVTKFAQFLYDLAKERVQTDRDTTESTEENEVVEELVLVDESLEQELLDEPLDTQKVEEEIFEEDDLDEENIEQGKNLLFQCNCCKRSIEIILDENQNIIGARCPDCEKQNIKAS